MAITLPVLLLLLFGFYELARANLLRNVAQGAAYEAAREVIVAGAHADDAEQVADDLLRIYGINSPQVTISPATITSTTTDVAVTVSFPMQSITGFGNAFLSGVTLQGECQLQREGFHRISPGSGDAGHDDDDDDD